MFISGSIGDRAAGRNTDRSRSGSTTINLKTDDLISMLVIYVTGTGIFRLEVTVD